MGHGGRGVLAVTGGCRTSLWAALALAGRQEVPQAGSGRSP